MKKKPEIRVLRLKSAFTAKRGAAIVSTVSHSSTEWERGLSPFILGPCYLYRRFVSVNVENGWQYSKVYKRHIHMGRVLPEYWEWARSGWANPKAVRYPMGRGKKPEFSLWEGRKLGYVDARKAIYVPLYARAVIGTPAFSKLRDIYESCTELILLDWDAAQVPYGTWTS